MFRIELPLLIEQWRTRTSDPARLWGLALGADLALVNRSRLDCLHTGYSCALQRKSLDFWWSVTSAEELRYQLECLFKGGYGDLFSRIVYAISEGLAFESNLDQPTLNRIEFVRARLPECRREGHIRAFDLARVPSLARFGYTACYINAKEAWRWTARASVAVQPLFASWHDFAANYRLGMEFWEAGEPDRSSHFLHRDWLLSNPGSPWVRLPWQQPHGQEVTALVQ